MQRPISFQEQIHAIVVKGLTPAAKAIVKDKRSAELAKIIDDAWRELKSIHEAGTDNDGAQGGVSGGNKKPAPKVDDTKKPRSGDSKAKAAASCTTIFQERLLSILYGETKKAEVDADLQSYPKLAIVRAQRTPAAKAIAKGEPADTKTSMRARARLLEEAG